MRGIVLNYRDVTVERDMSRQLREAESRRQALLESMIRAEDEERGRIAAELHDDTIQVMTASLLELDRCDRHLRQGDADAAREAIAAARKVLADATERTRRLTFELRPQLLEAAGLSAAVRDLAAALARETGAEVSVRTRSRRYPDEVETLVYRTVREALINVRRHARATHVVIRLGERRGALHGRVADDGRGFRTEPAPLARGRCTSASRRPASACARPAARSRSPPRRGRGRRSSSTSPCLNNRGQTPCIQGASMCRRSVRPPSLPTSRAVGRAHLQRPRHPQPLDRAAGTGDHGRAHTAGGVAPAHGAAHLHAGHEGDVVEREGGQVAPAVGPAAAAQADPAAAQVRPPPLQARRRPRTRSQRRRGGRSGSTGRPESDARQPSPASVSGNDGTTRTSGVRWAQDVSPGLRSRTKRS